MNKLGQWLFLTVFLCLVVTLGALHVHARLPSSDYISAMSSGQYTQAKIFLNAEVNKNNPQAQNALANLQYLGLGLPTDYPQAAKLYHAAASQGFAAAQLNLGHLYNQGLGVTKNTERAFGWYMHADIAGSPWAEYYMSQIAKELRVTPLQMGVIKERWRTLDTLVAEPL